MRSSCKFLTGLKIENGEISCTSTTCQLNCDNGFDVLGNPYLKCEDQKWSNIPSCRAKVKVCYNMNKKHLIASFSVKLKNYE